MVKEEHVREIANKFRSDNGNKHINNSDMLIYIMEKVDNLPCVDHMSTIDEVKAKVESWTWIGGILITVFLTLLFFILSNII